MLKCYIVQNINQTNNNGVFKENGFYIAKISCNGPNNISVLDINNNWIPFKWRDSIKYEDAFVKYFDIWYSFLIENKKELNEYIPTTKFYEHHNK